MSGLEPRIPATPSGTRVEHAVQALGTWAGGTTSAIYAYPSDAPTPASAQLWVGTAIIERASAYSFFPERTRVHVPIHGNGLRLHFDHPAEVITLGTFDQYCFDGARPVQAELIDGSVVAFNLITHTDVVAHAEVLRVDDEQRLFTEQSLLLPQSKAMQNMFVVRVVYAVAGSLALRIGEQHTSLSPDDAFVFDTCDLAHISANTIAVRPLEASAEIIVATLLFQADS